MTKTEKLEKLQNTWPDLKFTNMRYVSYSVDHTVDISIDGHLQIIRLPIDKVLSWEDAPAGSILCNLYSLRMTRTSSGIEAIMYDEDTRVEKTVDIVKHDYETPSTDLSDLLKAFPGFEFKSRGTLVYVTFEGEDFGITLNPLKYLAWINSPEGTVVEDCGPTVVVTGNGVVLFTCEYPEGCCCCGCSPDVEVKFVKRADR